MQKVAAMLFLAGGVCLAPAAAQALSDRDVFGEWRFRENGSVVRIYPCGKMICGKVISVKDRTRRDIHNPNPHLRNRPIVGIVIASNARMVGQKRWRGNLYNTLDGYTYRGTITLVGPNTITLVGCFAGWAFCEAKTLSRVKKPRPRTSAATSAPSRKGWIPRLTRP